MKKTKEMALLILFISDHYYSSVFPPYSSFLKLPFHKTKMTLNIVKAQITREFKQVKKTLLEALETDKRKQSV